MRTLSGASRLESFAREYIAPFGHHDQVRNEHLAEAVRTAFGLPDFPRQVHLRRLCDEVGIDVDSLPVKVEGLFGLNQQYGTTPQILLADDLRAAAIETTILHEFREVLENTFCAVDSTYVGIDTHDNKVMNPVSDRFAGFVLMPTEPSRALMAELGYDWLEFSRRTGRSLASVLLRSRQLFSSEATARGPAMGAWLFEADWQLVRDGTVTANDLQLCHVAALAGFSQARGTPEANLFPRRGDCAEDLEITRSLLGERELAVRRLAVDMFEEDDYLVIAERQLRFGNPWRLLVSAVRVHQFALVEPWLQRLGISTDVERAISL
jgi:hypothetical protein